MAFSLEEVTEHLEREQQRVRGISRRGFLAGLAALSASFLLPAYGAELKPSPLARQTETVFSPDGKRILFVQGQTDSWNIYIMNSDGSNKQNLTKEGINVQPLWSPDGEKIIFDGQKGFTIMNPDGSEQRLLLNADDSGKANQKDANRYPISVFPPAFSPDGKNIVYFSLNEKNPGYVCIAKRDGSEPRALAKGVVPTSIGNPAAWSPDGGKIAYAGSIDGILGVYVVNVDGTNQRVLTKIKHGDGINSPVWSPDGKKIAFVSGQMFNDWREWEKADNPAALYVMNSDGSELKKLAAFKEAPPMLLSIRRPIYWSPDGTRIAYTFYRKRESEHEDLFKSDIFVIDFDGPNLDKTKLKKVTDGITMYDNWMPAINEFVAWSPDGKKILYTARAMRENGGLVFIMNENGSEKKRLTDERSYAGYPWKVGIIMSRLGV